MLRNILEEEVDEKYFLSDEVIERLKGRVKTDNGPICVAMRGREPACLTTVQKDNLIIVSGTIRTFGGKHFREIKSGKSCTLLARARNDGDSQPCVQIGTKIRRLTPTECARLQTVPDWCVWDGISDTQRYKMLGNGWNIETIKHIFKGMKK